MKKGTNESSKAAKVEVKAKAKQKQNTYAGYIDELIAKGGTWDELVKKANAEIKKRSLRTKITKGSFINHIKIRESQFKGWTAKRKLKVTKDGIAIK